MLSHLYVESKKSCRAVMFSDILSHCKDASTPEQFLVVCTISDAEEEEEKLECASKLLLQFL